MLCVLADPSDKPRFATEPIWDAVRTAGHLHDGQVVCEKLNKATENDLRERLSRTPCDLIYFAGHAECRAGLHFTNIFLQSSTGSGRDLSGNYFAGLISKCPRVRTAVLQASNTASFCFEVVAGQLLEKGIRTVVMLPALPAPAICAVMAKLYTAIIGNVPLHSLENQLRAAHPEAGGIKVAGRETRPVEATTVRTDSIDTPVAPTSAKSQPEPELVWKRRSGRFDVFLCHHSPDKPLVIPIGQQLMAKGLLPWLDIWELQPGKPWQPELEKQISSIASAAIFVGATGIGPWQREELCGFIQEFVDRGVPVIPVLLPSVSAVPVLPVFLRNRTWVDFRLTEPDPFEQLVWGITGRRPEI